jgi:hypothetical protein
VCSFFYLLPVHPRLVRTSPTCLKRAYFFITSKGKRRLRYSCPARAGLVSLEYITFLGIQCEVSIVFSIYIHFGTVKGSINRVPGEAAWEGRAQQSGSSSWRASACTLAGSMRESHVAISSPLSSMHMPAAADTGKESRKQHAHACSHRTRRDVGKEKWKTACASLQQ